MADEEKDVRTEFLFARPSFWSGVARLIDLWGWFDSYNLGQSAEESDVRALYSDWRIIGQDLRDSWIAFHQEEADNSRIRKKGRPVCSSCRKPLDIFPNEHGRK
ncbi:MAG: hypothetical protein JO166_17865 [Deltaproteobacteria bacterium]|nr:hypothetical protein [Deltaproteobacteria bacterium]